MSEVSFSRRTLLLAGAGALAGAAVSPPGALAALGRPAGARPEVIELGELGEGGMLIELPAGVDLVGLQWSGPVLARPQVRVRLPSGRWGPWASAGAHGHGPDAPAAGPPTGEPLWTGGARILELRSSPPIAGARLHLLHGGPGGSARASAAALPLAAPVLAAGPGQPPIIARRAWARGVAPPRVAPRYGAVQLCFVHHTENPNGYSPEEVPAMLRAIYEFHRNVNGWNDIGYNFVVDLYGRIWEARAGGVDEPVVGAHAGGYNLVSSGTAVLGSFSETPISSAARNALQHLLAWKLSLHGIPAVGRVSVRVNPAGALYSKYPANARVSLPRLAGHRDADSTDCPGIALYGELGAIRGQVRLLAGDPVVAGLLLIPAPPAPGVEATPAVPGAAAASPTQGSAGTPAQLVATLRTLSGVPLSGVPLVLQARQVAGRGLSATETTVAEGLTDPLGRLVVTAAFAAGAVEAMQVRALYAGGAGLGAAVSEAVAVPPQPALTPPAATAPSP